MNYSLIASNYENQDYINEVEIKLEKTFSDSLVQIDSYTSSQTRLDMMSHLKLEGQINNQDTFSILCTRKNRNPIYYRAIFDNKKLFNSLNHLIERKGLNKKTILSFRFDDSYFIEEWNKIESLIKNRNLNQLRELFPKADYFLFLIERYLNSSYDNDFDSEKDLNAIKIEFSHYPTFREYLVSSSKKKIIKPIPKKNSPSKPIISKEKEEYEREYEKKLETLYGLKYDLLKINEYNRQYLEDDYEEFLEPEEMDQINGRSY